MDKKQLGEMLDALDPDAAKRAVTFFAAEFDALTAQVWAFGLSDGSRRALAIVSQMGAELTAGAVQLYDAERWYAGAALVRQIIEIEYLLFLFGSDSEEPERWLKATTTDVRRMFSPGAMRKRSGGRFRDREYASHCEIGGHPRRQGQHLLREHFDLATKPLEPLASPGVQWGDLALHTDRLWDNYMMAVARHSPSNVYPERFDRISSTFAAWRATTHGSFSQSAGA